MLNNFFEHIKKIKYSADYEKEIKEKMEKFIDIIVNNKIITSPKIEEYYILFLNFNLY
jgi:hypothetical protein